MANELATSQPGLTFGGLPPMLRQLAALAAIAAAVALGVAAVLWSQEPNYGLLFGNLSEKDSSQVLDGLTKANIPYKIEASTGAILVPASQVHEARLKLASQGLPRGSSVGFELMDDKPAFGVTQLQETARYQRAIEGELARSIATLSTVQSARVHLAIPKQSVFIRDQDQPRASVLINLYSGRNLDEGQVAAIVHLVSSSVPNLAADHVTVIDQKGRLLTANESSRDLTQTSNQLDYKRRLEADFASRVEEILAPVVGPSAVRAQVVADVDFTITEQTSEKFSPERTPVRSEQIAEDSSTGGATAGGVPGALTNQPPGTATAPEVARPAPAARGATVEPAAPTNSSKRATRNYEIDKTISHTKQATGTIRRLTVAVVVDDIVSTSRRGRVTRKARKPDEIERYTALVKEAVGFDEKRGDRVSVVNASFAVPPPAEDLPEIPFWKQDWFWDIAKQVGGGLVALVVLLMAVRPLMRSLAARPATEMMAMMARSGMERPMLSAGGGGPPAAYEQQLQHAKQVAAQDPKRVAQVVKTWVGGDA